jgi:hypothetical protein
MLPPHLALNAAEVRAVEIDSRSHHTKQVDQIRSDQVDEKVGIVLQVSTGPSHCQSLPAHSRAIPRFAASQCVARTCPLAPWPFPRRLPFFPPLAVASVPLCCSLYAAPLLARTVGVRVSAVHHLCEKHATSETSDPGPGCRNLNEIEGKHDLPRRGRLFLPAAAAHTQQQRGGAPTQARARAPRSSTSVCPRLLQNCPRVKPRFNLANTYVALGPAAASVSWI